MILCCYYSLHAILVVSLSLRLGGSECYREKVMASLENEPCHTPSASDQSPFSSPPPPPSNVCMQKFRLYETRSVMPFYSSFHCFETVVVVCCLLGVLFDFLILGKISMPLFILFLSISILSLFYFFVGFGFVEHVPNHFFFKKVLSSDFFFVKQDLKR